jgi:hypothetical protein
MHLENERPSVISSPTRTSVWLMRALAPHARSSQSIGTVSSSAGTPFSIRFRPSSVWTCHWRLQLTPQLTPVVSATSRMKRVSCSKTLDNIGLQSRCPGGGMAYAGDLKSPDAYASCGFDPHPGHQRYFEEIVRHCVEAGFVEGQNLAVWMERWWCQSQLATHREPTRLLRNEKEREKEVLLPFCRAIRRRRL